MFRKLLTIPALVLGFSGSAQAVTYQFDYVAGNGTELEGLFDADENDPGILTLTSVYDVLVNGAAAPATPFLGSAAEAFTNPTLGAMGTPTLSTDLSFIDVIACTTSGCDDGFLFLVNDSEETAESGLQFGLFFDQPLNEEGSIRILKIAGDDEGGNDEGGEDEDKVSAVPLPASGLLLLVCLGGLYALQRRRV